MGKYVLRAACGYVSIGVEWGLGIEEKFCRELGGGEVFGAAV